MPLLELAAKPKAISVSNCQTLVSNNVILLVEVLVRIMPLSQEVSQDEDSRVYHLRQKDLRKRIKRNL